MPDVSTISPRQTAHAAKDSGGLDQLARAGIVALGVVHLLLGWLAIQLMFGGGGEQADQQGAMRELAGTPVGRPLLWLIVAGLAGLVVWQLVEAAVGHRDQDDEKTRTAKRALSVGKAVLYGALAWSAGKVAAGGGSGSGDSSGETFTARLMSQPAGQVLVGLVGLAVIAAGIYFVRKGITRNFERKLEPQATAGGTGTALVRLGIAGHIAKGVAYGVLGGLFVAAAIEHDPERSGGLDDALKTLLGQPGGDVLVGAVGLGLAAYGAYCFGWARHLRRA
ncbi:MAG: DUF1206 domain-containing protein [Solirubrobacteraceae bacterium]|nr:DUF1206 domain-containing protein [Solirubrobacteraceae bacterium]